MCVPGAGRATERWFLRMLHGTGPASDSETMSGILSPESSALCQAPRNWKGMGLSIKVRESDSKSAGCPWATYLTLLGLSVLI